MTKTTERDVYKCISCGLVDESVEAGGIYYCPNPFCTVSGSTNWKIKNLDIKQDANSITIVSYKGWLDLGKAAIAAMPRELQDKIMALTKTKEMMKKLEEEDYDEEENS